MKKKMSEEAFLALDARERDRFVGEEIICYDCEEEVKDLLHYTTNISDAWEVVEVLRGSGLSFDLMVGDPFADDPLWCAGFWEGVEVPTEAQSSSAPLAIALAGLRVQGHLD